MPGETQVGPAANDFGVNGTPDDHPAPRWHMRRRHWNYCLRAAGRGVLG
jgi:hypothetical protein